MGRHRTNPGWPDPAKTEVENHGVTFQSDLRKIATALARFDKADNVDREHVRRAYQILRRLGLARRRFLKRPEFLTTIGALFFGTAGFYADASPYFLSDVAVARSNWWVILTLVICAAMFIGAGWIVGTFGSET